jgi:cytochrome P450
MSRDCKSLGRRSGSLPFASGSHHSLGRHLARREIRIALEALLSHFRTSAPGESYKFHSGVTFGVDRLPLAWELIS